MYVRPSHIALIARATRSRRPAAIRAALSAPALNWDECFISPPARHHAPPAIHCGHVSICSVHSATAQTVMAQAYRDNARGAHGRAARISRTCALCKGTGRNNRNEGLPLLAQLYPDPAERVLYDFDLLARDDTQARRGYEALLSAGLRRCRPNRRREQTSAFGGRLNGFVRRGYLLISPSPPRGNAFDLWIRSGAV